MSRNDLIEFLVQLGYEITQFGENISRIEIL